MGLLPKLERYRENGESVNAEEYGEPVRSLFTSTKILSLHHKIDITDERGKTIYTARTKFPSLHDKTDLYDAKGRCVAHIEKKFFSLHERHYIDMEDGLSFSMSNELFHLIKDITNIEGLGWQLRGNILGLTSGSMIRTMKSLRRFHRSCCQSTTSIASISIRRIRKRLLLQSL